MTMTYPYSQKVLVVGVGYWGSKLVDKFCQLVGAENVYASDLDIRAGAIRKKIVGFATDYKTLLKNVDCVAVATPPDSHYSIVEQCIKAQKHVFVEKPMATSSIDAETLIKSAHQKKLVLDTDLTFLSHPGWLGQDNYDDYMECLWSGPRSGRTGGNIWWVQGPHPISIMLSCRFGLPYQQEGLLLHDFCRLTFYFHDQKPFRITMDWNTSVRARIATSSRSVFDFDTGFSAPEDPLYRSCEGFLERVAKQDCLSSQIGLEVVRVLEKVAAWT